MILPNFALRFCLMLLAVANARADQLPQFSEYPAPDAAHASHRVDLDSHPLAPTYRTRLREAVKHGANFAGKYAIATWGCGTACITWAIINVETGKVYFDVRFSNLSLMPDQSMGEGEDYLQFRRNSTLLVIQGCLSGQADRRIRRYYCRWYREKIEVLRTEVLVENQTIAGERTARFSSDPD